MPTKPIGPASETAAPVASDALMNASRCVRATSTPRAAAASAPRLSRFSDDGSSANIANAIDDQRQRGEDRLEAADVEVAHQPARGAIDLREVGEVLHEHDQRREERVERHAGQQQHRRRHRAVRAWSPASRRWRRRRSRRRGWPAAPARAARSAASRRSMIASIAPSDAPAETPSVNGVASGLRSIA